MLVSQRLAKRIGVQFPQAVQRGQGMQSGLRQLRLAKHLVELAGNRIVAGFDNQSMRQVAHGPIRRREKLDQLRRFAFTQLGHRSKRLGLGNDAVNASERFATAEVRSQLVLTGFWQELGMLDHVAIHVGNPQRAIRPGTGEHRATPSIRRCEEILLPVVGAFPLEGHNAVPQHGTLNDVVKRFAGEGMRHVATSE